MYNIAAKYIIDPVSIAKSRLMLLWQIHRCEHQHNVLRIIPNMQMD